MSRWKRKAVKQEHGQSFSQTKEKTSLLALLEVVEQDAALLALLTPVLDDDAGAVDDLAGVALAVDLA